MLSARILLAFALVFTPALVRAAPPSGSLADAKQLHGDVTQLLKQGKIAEARPLALRELEIRQKALGNEHLDVAEALFDVAEVHAYEGAHAQAETLHRQALAIREKRVGKKDLLVASSLEALGAVLVAQRQLDHAEIVFRRALTIREEKLGKDHALVASLWSDIAAVFYYKSEYQLAAAAFERALEMTERALGPDAHEIGTIANNYAALSSQLGKHDRAEKLYRRALAIREKEFGPEHPDVARIVANLGSVATSRGDYVVATEMHERALGIREKALGKDHPDVAISLNNLASAYDARGDNARAETLYRRALSIFDAKLGPKHPNTIQVLHNLTLLAYNVGSPDVVPLLTRLFEARRGQLGNVRAADTTIAVARMAVRLNLAAEAREMAEILLGNLVEKYGEQHALVVHTLDTIAEAHYAESLQDAGRADPKLAQQKRASSLATYKRALALAPRALGASDPGRSRIAINAAVVATELGEIEPAISWADEAAELDERIVRTLLGAGSEFQKRAFVATIADRTDRLVTMHVRHAPADPRATRIALRSILRRKGRVLDAMADGVAALRRRLSPDDAALLAELAAARAGLAAFLLNPPASGADKLAQETDKIAKLSLELLAADLEAKMSARSAIFRAEDAPVTVESVAAALPDDAALVEIFSWRPFQLPRFEPAHYVAYVLRHSGDPLWVDLGDAQNMDDAARAFAVSLADPARDDVRTKARALDARLMQPIRKILGGVPPRLFISPDGALNLIPFGALVDEHGRFLLETQSISYLSSGRDLAKRTEAPPPSDDVIIANPDFGAKPAAKPTDEPRGSPLSRAFFQPLPGTADEARALEKLLPRATLITQAAATEKAVEALHRPRILHIATHGFFLSPNTADQRTDGSRGLDLDVSKPVAAPATTNPLLMAGLAFAHANHHGSSGSDGLLTALEASALDLWGTKLVVLSACETGLGVVENGEGVNGLRRALVMAGAESAIMSLWQVDDVSTRDLMSNTYEHLVANTGRAESLRRAQLEILARPRYAHPFYWASFIPIGDDRTLDGKAPTIATMNPVPGRLPQGAACRCMTPIGDSGDSSPIAGGILMLVACALRRARRL